MPNELAESRNAYYQKITDESTLSPRQELQDAATIPGYPGTGALGKDEVVYDGNIK